MQERAGVSVGGRPSHGPRSTMIHAVGATPSVDEAVPVLALGSCTAGLLLWNRLRVLRLHKGRLIVSCL